MKVAVLSREQMVQNWERVRVAPPTPSDSGPLPRALNLQNVMDLGNMVFFTFRGRAFGIPPLAWREGERLLDLWLQAKEFGAIDEREKIRPYFRVIRKLRKLIWRNCVPTGPTRRLLNFLHLHRNPFRAATEGEIVEIALFILGRRMRSSAPAPDTETPAQSPGT